MKDLQRNKTLVSHILLKDRGSEDPFLCDYEESWLEDEGEMNGGEETGARYAKGGRTTESSCPQTFISRNKNLLKRTNAREMQ